MIVINLQNQPSYSSYINLPDKLLSHHIEMTMGPGLGPEDFSFELWFNCKTPTPTLYPWQIKQLKSNLGGGSGEKIYIFLFLIRKIRQKHWHSLGFIEGLVGWRCERSGSAPNEDSHVYLCLVEKIMIKPRCAQRSAHVSRLMVNWRAGRKWSVFSNIGAVALMKQYSSFCWSL